MAFSTKITGIGLDAKHTWMMDMVSWWDDRELKKDPRFRKLYEMGYVDFVAVLLPSEALELHNAYCGKVLDHQTEKMMKLGQRLAQKPPTLCWVFVNVYEWESGL